jgi:hypothetical protein
MDQESTGPVPNSQQGRAGVVSGDRFDSIAER